MFSQTLHPNSKQDLTVTLTLPEEFLEKDVQIVVSEVSGSESEERQQKADEFFSWLRSLGVKTKSWKFNRDEANER